MKNEKINLRCPDCGKNLHEVIAEGQFGIKIRLDQCFDCGGIWFDSFELYPLPKDEIEKIDCIKLDKLQEGSFLGTGKKMCPKCETELESFKDQNFPKDLEVGHCKKCGGIWMNRGEAVEFKKWQDEKKNALTHPSEKDKEFQKSLRNLLETSRDDSFERIGKMGNLLSLKIDPITNRPLNAGDYGSEEYNKAAGAVSAAMSIMGLMVKNSW